MTLPIGEDPVSTAVDALQATVRAVLPTPEADEDLGVEVYDGPAQGRPFVPRSVTVAAAFEEDQDAIAVDRQVAGLGSHPTVSIDVACSAYVGSGDADDEAIDEYRAVMGAILTAIERKMQEDPTLGGVVARALLSSATWLQGRDGQGAGVMVGFVVSMTVLP